MINQNISNLATAA